MSDFWYWDRLFSEYFGCLIKGEYLVRNTTNYTHNGDGTH